MEDVEVTHPGGRTIAVIELHGEHDLATKREVADLLAREVSYNDIVVVDVSDARFIDCSILHNLVRADRDARARGSRFVLQMGTAPIVQRALQISGLLEQLNVADSRGAAIAPPATASQEHVSRVTASQGRNSLEAR
jgi:anti-anti-sigma factor